MLTETLLIIPFSVISRCSPEPTSHWLQEAFSLSKLPLQGLWSGLLEEFSKLVISKEQAKTLGLIFSPTKHKRLYKLLSMYRKYLFIIIILHTKCSSRDTIPWWYFREWKAEHKGSKKIMFVIYSSGQVFSNSKKVFSLCCTFLQSARFCRKRNVFLR